MSTSLAKDVIRSAKSLIPAFALILSVLVPASANGDSFIDTFEDGNFFVASSSFASNTQTGVSGAVGLVRTVEVFAAGSGTAVAQLAADDPDVIDDSITFATDSSAAGFFQYSYGTFTTAGDLNLDILNVDPMNQWSMLSIDYIANSTGTTVVTITDGTALSSVSQTYMPGTDTMEFSYADFLANSTGGPIDLTDISGIRFDVVLDNSPLPGSLSFSIFERSGLTAIPEPGTAAICVILGTVGMVRRRRR